MVDRGSEQCLCPDGAKQRWDRRTRQDNPTSQSGQALAKLLDDGYRVVRVRAVGSMVNQPSIALSKEQKTHFETALNELYASLVTRPDLWDSHYNMGNFLMDLGELKRAVQAYEWALKL